jgi:hypothetical protein
MENYKVFAKNPLIGIEDIIINRAIPIALKESFKELQNVIKKDEKKYYAQPIDNKNIMLLASFGMLLLREKGQENKTFYELFHGCILAAFLNSINNYKFIHQVCYPENDSYDFLILELTKGKIPDFRIANKDIYKNTTIYKVEFTEIFKAEEIINTIKNKMNNIHDYKGAILLVGIRFVGKIDWEVVFKEITKIKQSNFQTVWLIGQTNINNSAELYYFIAELLKHKEIYPLFELPLNWDGIYSRIKEEPYWIELKKIGALK